MDILYLLIPLATLLLLVAIWAFLWASNNKQFDDLERKGKDIIFNDVKPHSASKTKPSATKKS